MGSQRVLKDLATPVWLQWLRAKVCLGIVIYPGMKRGRIYCVDVYVPGETRRFARTVEISRQSTCR